MAEQLILKGTLEGHVRLHHVFIVDSPPAPQPHLALAALLKKETR